MAEDRLPKPAYAARGTARGEVVGVGLRGAVCARARRLGVRGWVRREEPGELSFHAEADESAVAELLEFVREGPGDSRIDELAIEEVKPEGHEQFAVRGISAGRFEVARTARGFILQLEVDGQPRSWTLPRGPSMDPAQKRMAFETGAEPATDPQAWDEGAYEQGGRVPWPEAIERGHAVFVLHGRHLQGGFALQRIRTEPKTQWLLIKRKDDDARPGSDAVAESGA